MTYTADQLAGWATEFQIGRITVSRNLDGSGWTVYCEEPGKSTHVLATDGEWEHWRGFELNRDLFTFTDRDDAIAAAHNRQDAP